MISKRCIFFQVELASGSSSVFVVVSATATTWLALMLSRRSSFNGVQAFTRQLERSK
jgi:hypothetical protein